jgi:hypothetical protein
LIHEQGEVEFARQPKAAIAEKLVAQITDLFAASLVH